MNLGIQLSYRQKTIHARGKVTFEDLCLEEDFDLITLLAVDSKTQISYHRMIDPSKAVSPLLAVG